MSELMELLGGIEPIPDKVDRCADTAANSFPLHQAVLSTREEYTSFMGRYYAHVEFVILGRPGNAECDEQFSFNQCLVLLQKEYGHSALQAPFELASSGTEGGLLKVLDTVRRLISRRYADNWIGLAVSLYWNRRSPASLVGDSLEYVLRYGHLWPSDLAEGSAARIRGNFRKVLLQHPYMMRDFRRVGR